MPRVFPDSLRFYVLLWIFKLLPCKHTERERPAYGMLGDLPLYFKQQHVVRYDDKG
jgi:hypothetical protein